MRFVFTPKIKPKKSTRIGLSSFWLAHVKKIYTFCVVNTVRLWNKNHKPEQNIDLYICTNQTRLSTLHQFFGADSGSHLQNKSRERERDKKINLFKFGHFRCIHINVSPNLIEFTTSHGKHNRKGRERQEDTQTRTRSSAHTHNV